MESEGATRIFGRSVEKYGVRYLQYYSDGDSKSFEIVENIYPSQKVVVYRPLPEKGYENLGHEQKELKILAKSKRRR